MRFKKFTQIVDDEHKNSNPGVQKLLPFCHTTTADYASGIVIDEEAIPQYCDIYKEDLLYFFYGKASYLTETEQGIYTDNPPITFIFDNNIFGQQSIKRILPFDSGGFPRFGLPKGYKKERFTYENTMIDRIIAFLNFIYANHDNYLSENVTTENLEKYTNVSMEMRQLLNAYDAAGNGRIRTGSQIYSFELQFSSKIKFEPTHIVLPYECYADKFWNVNFRNIYPEIKIVFYGETETIASRGRALLAADYQRLMREKVNEIIKSMM